MTRTYIGRSKERIRLARLFDDLRLSGGVVTPRIEVLYRGVLSPALIGKLKATGPVELLEWVGGHTQMWGM